jgi:hypothetical protein
VPLAWLSVRLSHQGERVDGKGESAEGALDDLTNAMRKSGQAFKVE